LLNGICPEVVQLLKDKPVNPVTFDALRRIKPGRQVETCRLMASTSNFSSSYAKALVAASKREDIKTPPRSPRVSGVTAEDLRLMERKMTRVQRNFRSTEVSYGQDMVALVAVTGYVVKLIRNARIARYLDDNHPEMLNEFQKIVSATSLDTSEALSAPHPKMGTEGQPATDHCGCTHTIPCFSSHAHPAVKAVIAKPLQSQDRPRAALIERR
jgi:RepB plasmid partitioning protein